jgi:transcription elongation GreA/GreB family factor
MLAPLGSALLGATVGDVVSVHAWGRELRWRVEAIRHQPEAAGDRHH